MDTTSTTVVVSNESSVVVHVKNPSADLATKAEESMEESKGLLALEKIAHGDCPVLSPESVSSSSSTGTQHNKSVGFKSVEIREFPTILGDNPSCVGPPLSLSWKCVNCEERSVDEYEAIRSRNRRLSKDVPRIPYMQRWDLLENVCGYNAQEITVASAAAWQIQRNRQKTQKWLFLSRIEEGVESCRRKVKRRCGRNKTNR